MIDITHIALFTPTACILSFVAKYYLDHRRRETSRGVYMTVSYVTAIVLSMSLEVVVSTAASFLFLARSRAGNKASLSGD